jgi:curli biogenesis system outer membrane secretion channel CsgG
MLISKIQFAIPFLSTLFLSFPSLVLPQEVKLNIAVNDLKCQGMENAAGSIISNRIRAELINTGAFRVMERAEMDNILKAMPFGNLPHLLML